jgi:serine/threonine protein phosphatase 1
MCKLDPVRLKEAMGKISDWLLRRSSAAEIKSARRRIDLGPDEPPYPVYAIGDVHGCLDQLIAAEERVAKDIQATGQPGPVVLLGDYVDRGPSSGQVLDHLVRPSGLGLRRLPICGNHDDLFGRFLDQPEAYWDWLTIGGDRTLTSYGIDLTFLGKNRKTRLERLTYALDDAVPPSHKEFLSQLPSLLRIGHLVFVHAGIRPGIPLDQQDDEDLMWIRDPFLSEGPNAPLLVIHGHTPQPEPDRGRGRIGIDTGAYYSGKLTVLKIQGAQVSIV